MNVVATLENRKLASRLQKNLLNVLLLNTICVFWYDGQETVKSSISEPKLQLLPLVSEMDEL